MRPLVVHWVYPSRYIKKRKSKEDLHFTVPWCLVPGTSRQTLEPRYLIAFTDATDVAP
jgi:hypothetical protein